MPEQKRRDVSSSQAKGTGEWEPYKEALVGCELQEPRAGNGV